MESALTGVARPPPQPLPLPPPPFTADLDAVADCYAAWAAPRDSELWIVRSRVMEAALAGSATPSRMRTPPARLQTWLQGHQWLSSRCEVHAT